MSGINVEGVRIPTVGPPVRQPITPFGATFGQGEQRRSDLALSKHLAWEDFGGGIGLVRADTDGQDDRYADAVGINTARRSEFFLETLQTSSAVVGSGVAPVLGVQFAGGVYIGADDGKVYKWNTSTLAWDLVDTPPASVTDLIVYTDNDGTDYLFAAYGSGYMHTTDGATWNDETQDVKYWTVFDNQLVAFDDVGKQILSDTTPASSPSWVAKISTVQGSARGLTAFRDQDGAPSVWYSTSTGLYQIDWTNSKVYEVISFRSNPFDNDGYGMLEWNGQLHFPNGQELLALSPQGTLVSIGPDRQDGLINADHGAYIRRIIKLSNFLLVLNRSATKATTFLFTGGTWHPFTTGLTASDFLLHETASGTNEPRLWNGSGTAAPVYQALNDRAERRFPFPGQSFQSTGKITSQWYDFGFPEFGKLIFEIIIDGRQFTDTEVATVEYQVDGFDTEEDWQVVGATEGESLRHVFELGGKEGVFCTKFRLRVQLDRGSDTTKTPIVEAVVMKYLPQPEIRWGWTVQIPVSHNIIEDWSAPKQEEWLYGLAETSRKKNLKFYPTETEEGTPFFVQVTNGPFALTAATRGASREALAGTAQITFAVPV